MATFDKIKIDYAPVYSELFLLTNIFKILINFDLLRRFTIKPLTNSYGICILYNELMKNYNFEYSLSRKLTLKCSSILALLLS